MFTRRSSLGNRKRTQQNASMMLNIAVGAHARSQRKQRHDGKSGILPKQPQSIPHVLKQCAHRNSFQQALNPRECGAAVPRHRLRSN